MAEFAQLRTEKWTDPLTFLLKLKLFDKSEFRKICQNVTNFEYKIQTPNRKLEDVLAYIEFECKLLKTLTDRRKAANQYDKTDEIDRFIYNEIYSQFGSAEITFQHKIEFWNARLKFIATVVRKENREVEFNRVFRKALDYCGRAHLELYQYCVDFMWTFLPTNVSSKMRKKLRLEKRNVTRIMTTIRDITKEALRNFPRSPEAFIWVISTEMKYLGKLRDEEELSAEAVQEETEKTERLIQVLTENLIENHHQASVYFQLYDKIQAFDVPQANHFSKKVYQSILSMQPRTLEIYSWLIVKSVATRNVDECLERVRQALASPLPKVKILGVCIEKLDKLLNTLEVEKISDDRLAKLLRFYFHLFDKENAEWSRTHSELYHISRIQFLKRIPDLKKLITSSLSDSAALVEEMNTFSKNNRLKETIKASVERFPTSFPIVRERILQYLAAKKESFNPAVVCKYLKNLNLRNLQKDSDRWEDVSKLLQMIYYVFISSPELARKVEKLLLCIPGTDEIRTIHLKKLYLEDIAAGRRFFMKYKELISDWKFFTAVVEIEANICHSGELSNELRRAIEDATRLAHTSSTVPWKTCILTLQHLKAEKEASNMLQRALKLFSMENEQGAMHQNLILFSKSYQLKTFSSSYETDFL